MHVNGHLTRGKDLGGVEAAYAAYNHGLRRHGPAKVNDGYKGDQRFFLS